VYYTDIAALSPFVSLTLFVHFVTFMRFLSDRIELFVYKECLGPKQFTIDVKFSLILITVVYISIK